MQELSSWTDVTWLSSPETSKGALLNWSQMPPGSHFLLSCVVSHFHQGTGFYREDRALRPRQGDEGWTEGKDGRKHFS